MTKHTRSGSWRGRGNQGSRERRRGAGREPRQLQLEGEVRWIDREADVVHVLVTGAVAGAKELVGETVEIGYARPRLRLRIRDRDGDGRLDGDDMALGDSIRASGFRIERGPDGRASTRLAVRRIEAA
jgi:hypothetical protein